MKSTNTRRTVCRSEAQRERKKYKITKSESDSNEIETFFAKKKTKQRLFQG